VTSGFKPGNGAKSLSSENVCQCVWRLLFVMKEKNFIRKEKENVLTVKKTNSLKPENGNDSIRPVYFLFGLPRSFMHTHTKHFIAE